MRKRLVKHGNSRTLVIDKAILELLNLEENDEVIVSTDGQSLTITPVTAVLERRARLDEAIARMDERYSDTLRRLAQ